MSKIKNLLIKEIDNLEVEHKAAARVLQSCQDKLEKKKEELKKAEEIIENGVVVGFVVDVNETHPFATCADLDLDYQISYIPVKARDYGARIVILDLADLSEPDQRKFILEKVIPKLQQVAESMTEFYEK